MTDGPNELPEAALRRVGGSAFTSGLSVADFAACQTMGLEPVAYVQGFCAMQWGWVGMGYSAAAMGGFGAQGGYNQTFTCPHGYVSDDHRRWGQNFEQVALEQAWSNGFQAAYARMVQEAIDAGAHGIVGVVDTAQSLADTGVVEFHLLGTAVKVADLDVPSGAIPWTTYLAGQRLAKIFEAGYAPVSVVATAASVRVWAYCLTQYLTEGNMFSNTGVTEIDQIVSARLAARQLAREAARRQLGGDTMHGASLVVSDRELGEGDQEIQCVLRGNRVRRTKDFDALEIPKATVSLS